MKRAGITHVLTVANDTPDVIKAVRSHSGTFCHKILEVGDFGTDEGIYRVFKEALSFFKSVSDTDNSKVFVHCANGSNRSPTIVVVYLRGKTSLPPCFLLDQPGPTKFVVKKQNDEEERRLVLIGRENKCSCGEDTPCVHILFVMTKVLRLELRDPIIWQRSLVDREVNQILSRRRRLERRTTTTTTTSQRVVTETKNTTKHTVKRRELKDGDEVCAICQDDMKDSDSLTWCSSGCGHNFHVTCMKQNAKFRKANGDDVTCPFCRTEWGEIVASRIDGKRVKRQHRCTNAGRGSSVHTNIACDSCRKNPIFGNRYRCLICKDVNLCKRCYQSQRSEHRSHPFVWRAVTTAPWIPARRESFEEINPQVIAEMQRRELSESDFAILEEFERRRRVPRLDEFLVNALVEIDREDLEDMPPGHLHGKPQCVICSNANFSDSGAMQARILPCCGEFVHTTCASSLMLSETFNHCPNRMCPRGIIFPGLLEEEEVGGSRGAQNRLRKRRISRSRRTSASSYDNLIVETVDVQRQVVVDGDNDTEEVEDRTRRRDCLAARVSTREQDRLATYVMFFRCICWVQHTTHSKHTGTIVWTSSRVYFHKNMRRLSEYSRGTQTQTRR